LGISGGTVNFQQACSLNELPTNLQSGLIAYYPFCGNPNDESGNGNNGTIYGGVSSATDRFGNLNSAYDFDGTSGYIEIPTLNSFQYTPVTYSAWVIVSSYFPLSAGHKFRSIVGRNSSGNTTCGLLGFYADQNISNGLLDNTFHYWMGGAANPSIPWSNSIPTINVWAHIVFTQDIQGNFQFYENGILVNSGTLSNVQNSNLPFKIGARDLDYFWDDNLDDIGVWNRVLTLQEIEQLYNSQNSYSWSTGDTTSSITSSNPTFKPLTK